MGEAKRKREARERAYATGQAVPSPTNCPACGSLRTRDVPENFSSSLRDTRYRVCIACASVWEPFPAEGYIEDEVCAEPCDNCAFRPGSPEQADPVRWKELLESLRPDVDGWFQGRFYCHKQVPIDMTRGPGNFLFPQAPITMDDKPVLSPSTGEPMLHYDISKMRTCSGFLRMFWAHIKKQECRNAGAFSNFSEAEAVSTEEMP